MLAAQVELPQGATLVTDPESLVVAVNEPQREEADDEDAATEAGGESAEAAE